MTDFLNAFRALRRSPGYVLTCVVVLTLGIGANAAIFSVNLFRHSQAASLPDPPGDLIANNSTLVSPDSEVNQSYSFDLTSETGTGVGDYEINGSATSG